ncbi:MULTISPECIES: hypothetical protein [unclassified Dysgonomonas]|uniref:hypothetical protein n=1 Tax=unclassified Dysgonomonas TaxID=2630389 RepID=UPI000681F103|nr:MULTISPECIES: hypothetical protein [unclassified Dysgonomonas]MBD8347084.1 hypothetical protein [Dysgonomonas sp. HGC4]MBF0574837.1 hypothetical protein [Dysgonomonas sp. GY617]
MKNYYISSILFLLPFLTIQAQIGINTETPDAVLEVLSSTSVSTGKAFVTSNSDNYETMQIRNDGYIGVGASNPLVKLDLRADNLSKENAIGIGYTTLTAANAGAGAIRYEETSKTLQYSDGETWLTLQANPDRAMVIARNSSGQALTTVNGVASSRLTKWTKSYDKTGSFDAVTGFFVAPRNGVYSASVTAVFQPNSMSSGAQYELTLTGGSISLKTVVPYLSTVTSINLTNTCKGLFYLTAGQQLQAGVYITSAVNPVLSTDASLNVLTIAEM